MDEVSLASLAEDGEEYREDYADDYACGKGKIEAELFSFNKYITWQTSDVGDLVGEDKTQAYYNEERTKYNKCPSYSGQFSCSPNRAETNESRNNSIPPCEPLSTGA